MSRLAAVGLTTLMLAGAVDAKGHPTKGEQCAAAKLKAATKKTVAKLACYQRAVAKDAAVSRDCLSAATAKFNAAFGKAETRGGCATAGDQAAVEKMVDDYVAVLVDALPSVPTTSTTTSTTSSTSISTTSTTTSTTSTTLACGDTLTPACNANGSCPVGHFCIGAGPTPGLACFCM
jgi:hypothetical protein